MTRILIVDDEEASREHLASVISRLYPDLEISAQAENGLEGLEIAIRLRPDIVFTDIRMPVMDGLKLVEELEAKAPDIRSIILSGYDDFEYARTAFRHGSVDYLLKPVNVDRVRTVMDSLISSIQESRDRKRLKTIREAIAGKSPESIPDCAKDDKPLWLAMLRHGGLVSRFSPRSAIPDDRMENGLSLISGRDAREWLLVGPASSLTREDFIRKVRALAPWRDITQDKDFVTCFSPRTHFRLADLRRFYHEACSILDGGIRLGRSRFLQEKEVRAETDAVSAESWDHRLDIAVRRGDVGEIKNILRELLKEYREKECPMLALESGLKRLFAVISEIGRDLVRNDVSSSRNITIEVALSLSESYSQVEEQLLDYVSRLFDSGSSRTEAAGIPLFFKGLCRYVESHYRENLSVGTLSDEFGLSGSYIGKLFRKHHHCSFTDFLRRCRIDAAREIIDAAPDITIQEVAQSCGFDDQFYFSKVFKSETGQSPRSYKAESQKNLDRRGKGVSE